VTTLVAYQALAAVSWVMHAFVAFSACTGSPCTGRVEVSAMDMDRPGGRGWMKVASLWGWSSDSSRPLSNSSRSLVVRSCFRTFL
jgi:hypothetical protein